MKHSATRLKIEYGDFQTPLELAEQVCRKLINLGVSPELVIEPTCGTGAFVEAAARAFPAAKRIVGVEINPEYLDDLRCRLKSARGYERVELEQGDFFRVDWRDRLNQSNGDVLILGNPPWVTNSVQGVIGGVNLPGKSNFQSHRGLDALTGKSNFDISEWMLIQLSEMLRQRRGMLAVLCKTSVARKLLNHLHLTQAPVSNAAVFSIDAAKYFGVSVEAGLLYCCFGEARTEFDYKVYPDLEAEDGALTGWRNKVMVRDLAAFDENRDLYGRSDYRWRSGIKHDCSEVMELRLINGTLVNGSGESVEIEDTFLYPLLKGSDIANGRVAATDRYLLVTQKNPKDDTRGLSDFAPKTWAYLESHADYLDGRKSRIYRDSPRFSVFGVGSYTFSPWKIAICGLYKRLDFRLVGPLCGKPVVFDDTVYLLDFELESEAREVLSSLHSDRVQQFLASMIFWDEKRPIKSAILNNLRLHNSRCKAGSLFTL